MKAPRITTLLLAKAIQAVSKLSLQERVDRIDAIHSRQPNIVDSIIIQSRLGSSLAHVEVLLELLLVGFETIDLGKFSTRLITEHMQDASLGELVLEFKKIEGSEINNDRLTQLDFIASFREQPYFALVTSRVSEMVQSKHKPELPSAAMLCALNLVRSIEQCFTE